ncbi:MULTISPECIES: DNA alkylation repair protein [Chryseobacterium]|uniref:DNA alkylation repair enzyme n=1 Tax=Chryseobacterium balustinum TaxID=246 RepID=A0AAX2ILF3_9FLAO|nr:MULTISPECIES: DNA alkylation repair protein [Chryseobacterium]AZB29748.1 HEAT repeat domain-containing protein [Chryseobacterium balustinum]MBM7420502.1 3-methyladenine DNA glycosylase AlkD [Chryseobacterium sp. JUb44]MDH6210453.1 3-methyladenine DNA glycosylase AlkD [Chryseobacterium sp. BIGb0186]WSO09147.1 DNA alkylation repair protein [Chryseobacterium scophthalmum]SKC13352.1 DNA alkylation repair enzyme [Chryseobacterium balustinum]
MDALIEKLKSIEHGFKHIIEAGDLILQDTSIDHLEFGTNLLEYDAYQIRMLATYLFGQLSVKNSNALEILETKIATDNNWRVQEMLAKAFDYYCQTVGYEKSLTKIKSWINDKNPNLKRAVIEGLRIWTNRPYFKENPELAIQLIAKARFDDSEYVRKSIGNSLRDISKKHKVLVDNEVSNWNLADKKIMFIQKLIYK